MGIGVNDGQYLEQMLPIYPILPLNNGLQNGGRGARARPLLPL